MTCERRDRVCSRVENSAVVKTITNTNKHTAFCVSCAYLLSLWWRWMNTILFKPTTTTRQGFFLSLRNSWRLPVERMAIRSLPPCQSCCRGMATLILSCIYWLVLWELLPRSIPVGGKDYVSCFNCGMISWPVVSISVGGKDYVSCFNCGMISWLVVSISVGDGDWAICKVRCFLVQREWVSFCLLRFSLMLMTRRFM